MPGERYVVLGLAPARAGWFRAVGSWANSGALPTDAEVVPYWRVLIEENRSLLGDRANPDLIFAGQVFSIPPVPPRAA